MAITLSDIIDSYHELRYSNSKSSANENVQRTEMRRNPQRRRRHSQVLRHTPWALLTDSFFIIRLIFGLILNAIPYLGFRYILRTHMFPFKTQTSDSTTSPSTNNANAETPPISRTRSAIDLAASFFHSAKIVITATGRTLTGQHGSSSSSTTPTPESSSPSSVPPPSTSSPFPVNRTAFFDMFTFIVRYMAIHPLTNLRRFRYASKGVELASRLNSARRKMMGRLHYIFSSWELKVTPDMDFVLDEDKFVTGDISKIRGERILRGEWVTRKENYKMGLIGKGENVMLYIHGGAYCICSPVSHRALTTKLAKLGLHVLALDYRLAPEHPFPAAIHDVVVTYRYLLETMKVPAENIFVGGDSAGGGLTLALLQVLPRLNLPIPAGAYLVSPWADMSKDYYPSITENYHHDYLGTLLQDTVDLISVYSGTGLSCSRQEFVSLGLVSPSRSKLFSNTLPPILIQSSPHEQLHHSIGELYSNLTKSSPNTKVTWELYEEMVHAFPVLGDFMPLAKDVDIVALALKNVGRWIKRVQSSDKTSSGLTSNKSDNLKVPQIPTIEVSEVSETSNVHEGSVISYKDKRNRCDSGHGEEEDESKTKKLN